MKQTRKPICRLLSMILAIVMVMSMLPATAWAADGTTLYLKPNSNWTQANARFAMYCFGNGETWVDMSDTDGDGLYEGTVPAGYPNVIFCRMNPSTTANNWNNKWNQSGDLTVPTDGTNCFTVAAGTWDGATTSWSTFTPVTPEPEEPEVTEATYIIAGDNVAIFGTAWDTNNTANQMTLNADGKYEKTYEDAPVGSYSFKVTDGTWTNCWGGSGTDGNYEFILDAISDVTITFDPATYTVSHTANPTGEVADPVDNVIIHFRNTGLWSEVHAYGWLTGTDTTINGGWPGNELTENADHKNWYTVELTGLNAPSGIGILFNNGGDSGKTGDITINADDEYWYDGQLLTEAPDTWADGSVATVDYQVTLHFADAKNWGYANLYTWTNTGTPTGSWPGTALAQGEDGFYSMSFDYEAPEGQGLSFIFSGAGQTVDLALDASAFTEVDGVYTAEKWVVATTADSEGKFYADIVDAPEAIAISPKQDGNTVTFQYKAPSAASVSVAGTMNDWTVVAMTKNAYGVWSVTLEDVAYGLHQYKLIVDDNWLLDPLNSWIYTEESGNQNSAFLISDPSLDQNKVYVNVHYAAPTTEWNVCAWGAKDLAPQYNFTSGVTTITLDGRANQYVAFKVRKSVAGNDWAEQSGEIRVDLTNIVSGTIDIWVGSDFSVSQSLNADVVYANKVKSVELNYDNNTIVIKTAKAVADAESAFAIYCDGVLADIIDSVTVSGGSTILSLTETLDLVNLYRYKIAFLEDINEAYQGGIHVIGTNTVYASDKFAEEFTYDGELGALWTANSTTFRVWAPTAEAVTLNLYVSGTDGVSDPDDYSVAMTAGEDGTWVATVEGDLNGTYYTYTVHVDGQDAKDVVDPYARTTGVNGKRGMVIDLDSTDPEGWDEDCNPNPIEKYSDAIIYELHVRDFSIDESSGVSEANRGKYLAFTEKGTTTANGTVTGIDYLEDLGITHLHLLPVYDYGSVDETKCENFNWGYDPVNYNAPEGSYSTAPYNGEVRVKEFKEMVMALHEADISVIMDVVYNHVYDAGQFSMNQIVPKYFSRVNADGSYSNGSGCGNDTASEREMVRKFIVESVLYWHQEYHIDGFRFDLVGLLDATTIKQIVEEVHACCPDVIFYGEGWTMGTAVEPGNGMATQANSAETPDFAYFSDTIRNLLAGSNGHSRGFVSGLTGQEEAIRDNFMAKPNWTKNPQQIVQYASCHDNYTLIDKLILSTGKSVIDADIIKMNNLAAAIYMTSQGIPFIHAGEEFLREKLEEDGSRCENSYNASDFVNHIEWSKLENETYAANVEYYKGLIEFRKAHESLRLETRAEIDQYVTYTWVSNEVVMFEINGEAAGDVSDSIIVIFNATDEAAEVNLPLGTWDICIDYNTAGTESLGTAEATVSVAGISAMALVPHAHSWENGSCTACYEVCLHNAYADGKCCKCGVECTHGTYESGVCSKCGVACTHENVTTTTVDATCAADGSTTVTCDDCGETVSTKTIPATGEHTYVDGSCTGCGAAEPVVETITVYFQNNWKWSEVKAYFWIGDQPQSAAWPGDDMTLAGNDGNYDVYSVEIPTNITGLQINGVKDDGSGNRDKTPDITSGWYDGICYYMTWSDGNQVGSEDISVVLPEDEDSIIIQQPVDCEGNLGEFAIFTVVAEGEDLTYQWYYYNTTEEAWLKSYSDGSTTDTVKVQYLTYRDGQQYRCEITDAEGNTVISDEVAMTLKMSVITINAHPQDATNAVLGRDYTFTASVTGDNLTYLWEYSADNGETWQQSWLEGYNTNTLTVKMNANRSGNLYRCRITGVKAEQFTEPALLKLQDPSVEITADPEDIRAATGDAVAFAVVATGSDLTYAWYRSDDAGKTWTAIDCTAAELSLEASADTAARYKCKVTDGSGTSAWSKAAKLLVVAELKIVKQPENVTIAKVNDNVTFTVEANGDGLKYLWYTSADGGNTWKQTWLAGYNTNELSFVGIASRIAKQYKCVITDAAGNTVETNAVRATVG